MQCYFFSSNGKSSEMITRAGVYAAAIAAKSYKQLVTRLYVAALLISFRKDLSDDFPASVACK